MTGEAGNPIVTLRAGDIVGERYRVIAQLGAGGMGTVYRVEHTLMAKEMAMKLLRPELSVIPQIAERFEREARSASRLDNLHIVRVTDFGKAPNGSLFLVMELLDGESLTSRISRGGLAVDEGLDLIDQILAALEHAHTNGVVHRDLKPDNMMLVPRDGRTVVKILDFGLAKLTTGTDGEATLTQTGMVFGTPRYMAPEQAAAEPMDARTDLYAVGVLLFELMTGRPPFEAPSAVDLLTCHLTQSPPPLEMAIEDRALVAKLEKIVFRAMAKHKKDRFQSATEFREAITECRGIPGGVPMHASALPRGTSSTPRLNVGTNAGAGGSSAGGGSGAGGGGAYGDTVPGLAGASGYADTAMSGGKDGRLVAPGVGGAIARAASSISSSGSGFAARSDRRTWFAVGGAVIAAIAGIAIFAAGGEPSQTSRYQRAEEALANGDLNAARAVMGQLVAQDANDPRTLVLLGHIAFAENDIDGAVASYKRALELDGSVVADPVLASNAKRVVEKNHKASATLVTALALHANSAGVPLLVDIAQNAPLQRMRSHAFQALERLNETERLNLFEYLSNELDQVRAESCKTRKWYIDRLAALEDPRVLPILKRERGRKGGILNLESVNGCMSSELNAYISKREKE